MIWTSEHVVHFESHSVFIDPSSRMMFFWTNQLFLYNFSENYDPDPDAHQNFFFIPLHRTNSIETIALKEVRNNLRCCSQVKIYKWSTVTQINTRFSLDLRKQHWNCRFHTVFGFSLTINNSRLTEYGKFPQQLCRLHHQLPSPLRRRCLSASNSLNISQNHYSENKKTQTSEIDSSDRVPGAIDRNVQSKLNPSGRPFFLNITRICFGIRRNKEVNDCKENDWERMAEAPDQLNVAATSAKTNKVIKACGW